MCSMESVFDNVTMAMSQWLLAQELCNATGIAMHIACIQ